MIDFLKLPSPCYVLDEELLDRNLATVDRVRRESGAEIIVALKACAMWSIFPELAKHSDGATASSAAEARLVFEEFGRPAHTYAPVYTDSNIDEILNCSDHITFNSLSQFRRFGQKALINGISCGLRINPQYSPVETDLYNPCVPGSRLGVTAEQLAAHGGLPAGVEGLHFHVLCESRPEHLQKALEAVETHFGAYLDRIKWLNMGGGRPGDAGYQCVALAGGDAEPPGGRGPCHDGYERRAQRRQRVCGVAAEIHHVVDGFRHRLINRRHHQHAQKVEDRRHDNGRTNSHASGGNAGGNRIGGVCPSID